MEKLKNHPMNSTEEIQRIKNLLEKFENLHASFDYLRISIASPKRIRSWAQRILPNGLIVGEITRPETINFRTHQPEYDGLFCELIFGPIESWKCRCGKYNGFVLDKICEDCKVEIIDSRVRRYRMGYIELTCPVAHIWYLKGNPKYLSVILKCIDQDLNDKKLEQVIYFKEGSKIIDSSHPLYRFFLEKKEVTELESVLLSKKKYKGKEKLRIVQTQLERPLETPLRRKGAEIIKAALESLNLKFEIKKARGFLISSSITNFTRKEPAEKNKSMVRRIRVLESFIATATKPEWMILTVLPVLPPNLRPLVELESGRLVAADINEIYRLIITRNNRLFDFLYRFTAPDIISVQARKLLQEGVDALIYNSRLSTEKIVYLNNKPLKSLTEILEGKQGRFRQSLLGKRVDYSGRSVIIVNPLLRMNQCGLPYEMGVELFRPFLAHELLKTKIKPPSHNTKLAHLMIKKNKPFIWTLLEKLMRKKCILLNRAPTLHRFGIQAFNPVLILGQAIEVHPLVCTGFNADFDGDQMAVHLPLYQSSQLEVRSMMRPSSNLQSPANGDVIVKPTQDMVIGSYYLTFMIQNPQKFLDSTFSKEEDVLSAFSQKKINIHTRIFVRYLSSDFKFENNNIIFLNKKKEKNTFFLNKKKIIVFSSFLTPEKNCYFFTNLGVFVATYLIPDRYQITTIFLETTPGRILFHQNLKPFFKKTSLKL